MKSSCFDVVKFQFVEIKRKTSRLRSARFSLIYAYKILSMYVGVEMLGDVWYNWGDKFFVWGCAVAEINYAPQSKMLYCRFF